MDPILSPKPAYRFWILSLISLFLILYLSELLEASMFIDGVWYAVISNNLSNGIGSLWHPQFSDTIFSSFYEHPPLVFGLQALFFRFFGDHFWTERLFSLLSYGLSAWLIIAFWKKVVPKYSVYQYLWVLPLIFWQANLVNYFFLPANLLDTPLSILSGAAVLLMLRSADQKRGTILLVSAGAVLAIAMLTKGVVGLFPFAFIGIHYLLFKPYSWAIAIKRTLIVFLSFMSFLFILFFAIPESWMGFKEYLDVQLFASLSGERRLYYYQSNRFYILGQLLWTLAPMIFTGIVISLLGSFLKTNKSDDKATNLNRHALLFLLTGLSASLPIMISPRQALPYLIPSLPYFTLAISIWIAPKVHGYNACGF